jgi:type IV pilus assembly protein PilQ
MVSWSRWSVPAALTAALLLAPALSPPLAAAPLDDCLAQWPTEKITLSLRDANVQTTLRLLAQQYRVNLVVTEDVIARATFDFFQVPVRDLVRAVITSTNLQCFEAGGVLRVSTYEKVKKEDDERARTEEARVRLEADTRKKIAEAKREEAELELLRARGPIREETIRLSYADAEEVAKTLQGILGLPPEGLQLSPQLQAAQYLPPVPVQIPSGPQTPITVPQPIPIPSSDALAKGLTVRAHKPTNTVFIRYYSNDLERIKKLISESLDIPLPQVVIDAQMLISTRNALEQLGVQWGGAAAGRTDGRGSPVYLGTGYGTAPLSATGIPTAPTGGTGTSTSFSSTNPNFTGASALPVSPTTGVPVGGNLVNLPTAFLPTTAGAQPALGLLFGLIGRDFNINLAIQALEVQGKARRLAGPKIVTVENAKAEISRGFEVPFVSTAANTGTQVQFKEALLKLSVVPNVIREGDVTRIRMRLVVENNEPDFSGTRSVAGNPSIFKRRTENEVVVREGDRLVIGGVMIENRATTIRQVPVLGRVPVLGWLFKSREESGDAEELTVVLTPALVRPPAGAAVR